ncbi:hypothetical protein G9C98_001895 [Cotesia typhae]|uniref:Bee-milk protein n=1 Tax=Cotesia typhae TaxID=2053667 RepID=A0A8J5UT85_9HYME|nr:hypothetical protein G9C98_001895 [Cotesia typhae]
MTRVFIISLLVMTTASVVLGRARNVPQSAPDFSDLKFFVKGRNLVWPSPDTEQTFSRNGRYDRRSIIGTKIQLFEDQVFIAFPRLKPGVPITLGVAKHGNKNIYEAFPCWAMQEEGNCDGLQSVVDISVDDNGILWALDTGIVNTLTQPVFRCKPKVFAFNIRNKELIKVIDLSKLVIETSRLQNLIVDYGEDGKVYLYIGDASGRGIIVYDVVGNSGFRMSLPQAVNLANSKKDVLQMVLVRKATGPELYFTYLGSSRVFSIRLDHLRRGAGADIIDVGSKLNSMVFLGTNGGNVIFFRYKGQPDVYLWDTNTAFGQENFVIVQKGDECHLPTNIAVGPQDTLWTIESNLQDYIHDTIPSNGVSMIIHPLVKNC